MKSLIIIGASGFGREVAWLVERINEKKPAWNLLGFVDDNKELTGKTINGYPVLGPTSCLEGQKKCHVVCAIGSAKIRRKVTEEIRQNIPAVKFATLIDPAAEMSGSVTVGEGSIICAHTIITVNAAIGRHVIINLDCMLGHDSVLNDYVTLYPSVNVSGNVIVKTCTEIGTGTHIIQGIDIGSRSVIGAGSVVIRDIPDGCTAVGSPAKPIKFFDGGADDE